MIQNFGGRNFWRNSSQQRLVNNILANAQNRVNITKHSLVTYEIICCRDITCNVSKMCDLEQFSKIQSHLTLLMLRSFLIVITTSNTTPKMYFCFCRSHCNKPSIAILKWHNILANNFTKLKSYKMCGWLVVIGNLYKVLY